MANKLFFFFKVRLFVFVGVTSSLSSLIACSFGCWCTDAIVESTLLFVWDNGEGFNGVGWYWRETLSCWSRSCGFGDGGIAGGCNSTWRFGRGGGAGGGVLCRNSFLGSIAGGVSGK